MTAAVGYQATRVRRLGVTPDMRDVRVVHELDGIAGAVAPAQLLSTGQALWRLWCDRPGFATPGHLLGLDAGGILPTVAVALASGVPYRLAWKLDLDLPGKHRFVEPHARRSEVFTYGAAAGDAVLIVDDEITTGETLANLVTVLREAGSDVLGVVCLVEDRMGDGRAALADLGVPLCALRTL